MNTNTYTLNFFLFLFFFSILFVVFIYSPYLCPENRVVFLTKT